MVKKVILILLMVVTFLIITTDVEEVTTGRYIISSSKLRYIELENNLSSFSVGTGNLTPEIQQGAPSQPNFKPPTNSNIPSGGKRAGLVNFVYSKIGLPYLWGATGAITKGKERYDCSGLMMKAYESVGIKIPRHSLHQKQHGRVIRPDEAKPGDLIWVQGHIGMYVGDGKIVEASGVNDTGQVKETPVTNKWWIKRGPVYVRIIEDE